MAALVESIPRDGIQKRKSVHQTQMDLGSELGLGPGLSTDDWTYMGLIDTDYPVLHLMACCFKHRQLLPIQRLDDPVLPLHPTGEWKDGTGIQLFFNRLEVPF
ncbi:hypothetical protein [Algoriphagus antarcticus]|uniref:hypothetical protein n=1 Tax=Algoriphagus antarcticus TaxID=238540 RepID=UPI002012A7D0|nr:hypothetical protein [Algoriphagus antarcticus]